MHRNEELYQFLLEKTWQLTEDWYQKLNKSQQSGVYASNDPAVIDNVKQQNYKFHQQFCEVFIKDESAFYEELETWIMMIAQDDQHSRTPIQYILREFFNTQDQYLDLINIFRGIHKANYTEQEYQLWIRVIIRSFSKIMIWFTEEYNHHSLQKLQAQQQLIVELSSPVISLTSDIALLPLVGDIDTARAKIILENTLQQCAKLRVNRLMLDLSGVVMIDTLVAHHLYRLIDALNLIGVQTTLSGVRPEIAQTAVQLGLSFTNVKIASTLSNALNLSTTK